MPQMCLFHEYMLIGINPVATSASDVKKKNPRPFAGDLEWNPGQPLHDPLVVSP